MPLCTAEKNRLGDNNNNNNNNNITAIITSILPYGGMPEDAEGHQCSKR